MPTPDPRRRPGTTSNNDAKGKGKAVDQIVISPTLSPRTEIVLSRPVPILSTCFICMDPITLSSTPYESSKSASTSDKLQFGMAIGKAGDHHIGCIGCLTSYINGKLEDVTSAKVFPLKCPGVRFFILLRYPKSIRQLISIVIRETAQMPFRNYARYRYSNSRSQSYGEMAL